MRLFGGDQIDGVLKNWVSKKMSQLIIPGSIRLWKELKRKSKLETLI